MHYSGDDIRNDWLCTYGGATAPTLRFRHNSTILLSENNSGHLSIPAPGNLSTADSGVYVCEALAVNGSVLDSDNFTVTVIGETHFIIQVYLVLSHPTRC